LPQHYGYLIAFWSGAPALLILLFWSVLESSVINAAIVAQLPAQLQQLSADEVELFINEIINLSYSNVAIGDDVKRHAALYYNELIEFSNWVKSTVVFILAFIGMFVALAFVKPEMKARNLVERLIRWAMIGCTSIAVLTTIGIIFSVIFESIIFCTVGMPARISKTGLANNLNLGDEYSDKYIADISPKGTAITKAINEINKVPTNKGKAPKLPEPPTWSSRIASWGLQWVPNKTSNTLTVLLDYLPSQF
jgi:hypothetical protein